MLATRVLTIRELLGVYMYVIQRRVAVIKAYFRGITPIVPLSKVGFLLDFTHKVFTPCRVL